MVKVNQKIKPNLWVAIDAVIFSVENDKLKVLLIKRSAEPFKNRWALPGGLVVKNETAHAATKRILRQKTGFSDGYIEQLYTFDDLRRDPRGRVISITYFALVPNQEIESVPSADSRIILCPIKKLAVLAFDHQKIIQYAIQRLRFKLEYTNAAYSLLPRYFTFGQLQKIYEIILDRKLDKRNFRKKFLMLGLIKSTGKTITDSNHRPAQLYQFISRRPLKLKNFF